MFHITPQLSTIINTCIGIFVSVLTAYITHKIKQRDEEMIKYRKEREQKEKLAAEELRLRNEANDQLTLGMARTMLLDNYEKCIAKGYYSIAEREVYHRLYEAYRQDNGNGIIEQIGKKIVLLPTEPPHQHKEIEEN